MSISELSRYECGDTAVLSLLDKSLGRVSLELFPLGMESRRVDRRSGLKGEAFIDAIPEAGNPPSYVVDPLVHVKLVGDSYSGAFAQGRTMRCASSNERFEFREQRMERGETRMKIITVLETEEGLRVEHTLAFTTGEKALEVDTRFINGSPNPVTLEMLTSFSLGGISPFLAADGCEGLRVHRFRSVWSAEGRHETRTIEELHLERSWSGAGAFSERFGQVGSMPVRGWFPWVAVEDTANGVCWGAQLAWAGSWQMEIFRQHDDVCISGGLADREMGYWCKTLAPGEELVAPPAAVTCVRGDLDDVCDRLTALQHHAADLHPAVERDLPVVFNEWCTTWGDPSHERVTHIAEALGEIGVRYLVIDAGWYKTPAGNWDNGHGDWIPSPVLFPKGLAATAAAIRGRGLIPGLWFEMETVGARSTAFSLQDMLLHRDGMPLTVRGRRFWNLNHPAAIDYLAERVIDLLERCEFGYLKVDYNETIGIGCEDGAESLGEGLRRQIEGVYRFFDRIRKRLPELVIENCSSGGHRLEPSMLGRTAMSSFSDAHELVEIPIIAANLHRLMLPRQEQIWAVLHAADDDRRLTYSVAATFLGRMCLSGEIDRLAPGQRELVRRAITLYQRCAPIIKHGMSRHFGTRGSSWRHPRGWQAVVRQGFDQKQALVVAHGFADAPRGPVIPLPAGHGWQIVDQFHHSVRPSAISGNNLIASIEDNFPACVVLLSRNT